MIVTSKIQALKSWVNENRPDKESKKPYFLTVKDEDGNYQLPNNDLIKKGLKELKQNFKIVTDIEGVSVEIESTYL